MPISGDQLTRLMVDICWLSLLLLIGKYLRAKLPFLQKLFMPASVIAGFIGLLQGPFIFGKYVFNLIPIPMVESWSLYPGRLINKPHRKLEVGDFA
ncbi:hypothetical protein ACFLT9_04715 [Acidobacteriota bacterium]